MVAFLGDLSGKERGKPPAERPAEDWKKRLAREPPQPGWRLTPVKQHAFYQKKEEGANINQELEWGET